MMIFWNNLTMKDRWYRSVVLVAFISPTDGHGGSIFSRCEKPDWEREESSDQASNRGGLGGGIEIFRWDFENGGGIGIVEMLFRCNILALVGGDSQPQYPLNKVMIWDDHQDRCICELSFRSEVCGVRLRRDRIIVILEQKIFVYNFTDLKLLQHIETFANPKGLCDVSQASGNFVLVCLGLRKGQVRVEHYASKRTKFILAHDSRIACFALSQNGNMLATASNKGTLVRIFNTHDGSLLHEVRRGGDRAEIHSLAFSPTAEWLAVSSDKGTIHVFSITSVDNPDLITSSSRLLRWTQFRLQWVDHKMSKNRTKAQEPVLRRKVTYNMLQEASCILPRSCLAFCTL
ncbi:unnamed protein product [Lactuca virosa]|uniref:Anaphase-promoting complex subunit 4 WD40 domain-containing protein n=1 Tax=Lactuca virosa TaxID=75947 RepID=A0AAU9PCF7_9ASTR|nr:unnamed protein product [Lactuca virosa]